MKTKLLNQINFNAIEPMSDKQMVELNGGGLAKKIAEFIDKIISPSDGDGICIANNCDCTNPKC